MRFSERKGAEKVIFSGNCPYRFVWEQDAAGSRPVTSPTVFISRIVMRCIFLLADLYKKIIEFAYNTFLFEKNAILSCVSAIY